jgi:hypothetical protein
LLLASERLDIFLYDVRNGLFRTSDQDTQGIEDVQLARLNRFAGDLFIRDAGDKLCKLLGGSFDGALFLNGFK